MQMFTVPQFIDVEDKIIGPVTTRQFIICLVAMGILVPAWKFLGLGMFIAVALLDIIVFGSFAFVKINGRPFHYFILNIIQTTKKPRLRIWNHKNPLKDLLADWETAGPETAAVKRGPAKPRPVTSRLKELSLIVDTKGIYKGDEGEKIL
jgi:hypothetical protein